MNSITLDKTTSRNYTIVVSYISIFVGITGFTISMLNDSHKNDEKTMSTVIFMVIAFVEIMGAVLVLSIWQRRRVENRTLKEVQCSIVLGGLMIFMGIFFVEDGLRLFVYGHLSSGGRQLRLLASCFSAISGYNS